MSGVPPITEPESKANNSQPTSQFDPEILAEGFYVAIDTLEAGGRAFPAFASKVIETLGEGARPYLRVWYESIRHYPGFDNTGMTPFADLESAKAADDASMQRTVPPPSDLPKTWVDDLPPQRVLTLDEAMEIARQTWRRHFPKLWKELKESGATEEFIRMAARQAVRTCSILLAQGVQPMEAKEIAIREQIIDPAREP